MTARDRVQALARGIFTFDEGTHGRLVGQGDPSSISIDGNANSGAVLAFHGFAGTPREVSIVTDVASRLGFSARAPRLSGHTDHVRDLMNVGWNDWTQDAARALTELDGRGKGNEAGEPRHRGVVVCGLSLGALLATHLAATEPERVAALVVLANATWLRFSSFRLPLGLLERLEPFDNRFYMRKFGADIRDPVARRTHLTYELNPIKSAIEVIRAGRIVRPELSRVRCPTLVIHGRLDRVCPVRNAFWFARRLGTDDVDVRIMPRSGHIVTLDVDRRDVELALETFLSRYLV